MAHGEPPDYYERLARKSPAFEFTPVIPNTDERIASVESELTQLERAALNALKAWRWSGVRTGSDLVPEFSVKDEAEHQLEDAIDALIDFETRT